MKLPHMSGVELCKVLCHIGYRIERQRGSHIILEKNGFPMLSIPNHHELDIGTLKSILRKAGVSTENFLTLIR